MLNKLQIILIAIFILSFGAVFANAQVATATDSTASNSTFKKSQTDEFNKNEFYGGYSYQRFDNLVNNHGFEVAYTRNVRRFVGIKTNFAFRAARTSCPECGTGGVGKRIQSSLHGGIQIKDNAKETKIKPFAHFLTGWSRTQSKLCNGSNLCGNITKVNQFSTTFGGGLDVKVSNRISVRVIQVDYNPTFSEGFKYHNVNVGAGIVFH